MSGHRHGKPGRDSTVGEIEAILAKAFNSCPPEPTLRDIEELRGSIEDLAWEVFTLRRQLAAMQRQIQSGRGG